MFDLKAVPHPTKCFLLALSSELIHSIAEWVSIPYINPPTILSLHGCVKPLASLALISRHLNQITTPLLYRTFVQTQGSAIPTMLRLLVNMPEIGSLVKRLVISELDESIGMDMLGFSRKELGRLGLDEETLEHFEIERPDWIEHVEAGEWQAVVALLLVVLPSLQEIDFVSYHKAGLFEFATRYTDTVLEYAAAKQLIPNSEYCLRNLKKVSMKFDDRDDISIGFLLLFCALPSITAAKILMGSRKNR